MPTGGSERSECHDLDFLQFDSETWFLSRYHEYHIHAYLDIQNYYFCTVFLASTKVVDSVDHGLNPSWAGRGVNLVFRASNNVCSGV